MEDAARASEPVKIEIVDKRQHADAENAEVVAEVLDTSGAAHEQHGADDADGSFCETTPEADSEERLRARDDAERYYSGGAYSSSALGSEADVEPDVLAQLREYRELVQRKEAEFRNYRAKERERVEDARRYAIESMLHDLFPVLDGLAQALQGVGAERDSDPVVVGLRNTAKALEKALLRHGVEAISEAGVDFDSELHQPVQVEISDQVTADKVIEIYTAGYRLHGKVLKPAMVKVLQPE
jgi:molecular chaperone GrpE